MINELFPNKIAFSFLFFNIVILLSVRSIQLQFDLNSLIIFQENVVETDVIVMHHVRIGNVFVIPDILEMERHVMLFRDTNTVHKIF